MGGRAERRDARVCGGNAGLNSTEDESFACMYSDASVISDQSPRVFGVHAHSPPPSVAIESGPPFRPFLSLTNIWTR